MTKTYASAGLPMYDWPEVRTATDRLWGAIRASLAARGISAPQVLEHHEDVNALWHRPDLLLAQTCGLAFARELKDRVRLLGTPAYAIDCQPGDYYSCLIVPTASSVTRLAGFSGRIAVNGLSSQSGYAALLAALADANDGRLPAVKVVVTGSHRHSLRLVAAGDADLAAIDAVSFELAKRHMPETAGVRVIGKTDPVPGLPLISALPEGDVERLRAAITEAIADLDPAVRETLLLTGFVPREPTAYDGLERRWAALQPLIETAALPVAS